MSFSRSGLSESLVTDTMVAILPPFALAKAAGSRAAPDEIAGADTSCGSCEFAERRWQSFVAGCVRARIRSLVGGCCLPSAGMRPGPSFRSGS